MNKYQYGVIIFILIFLVACGGGSSTTQKELLSNNNESDLIGTWEKVCSGVEGAYYSTRFSHSNTGKLVVELRFYSDFNCTNENGNVTFQEYTFKTGDEITTIGGVIARKIEFDLIKTVANGVVLNNQLGTLYDIYLVQNNVYYQGLNNGVLQEENRPGQLDFNRGATKVSNGVLDMPTGIVEDNRENPLPGDNLVDGSNNNDNTETDFGELNFSGNDIEFVGSLFFPTISRVSSGGSTNSLGIVWSEGVTNIAYAEQSLLLLSVVDGGIFSISFIETQALSTQLDQPAKVYSWLSLCFLNMSSCENAVLSLENRTIKFTNFELSISRSVSNNLAESILVLNGTLTWSVP